MRSDRGIEAAAGLAAALRVERQLREASESSLQARLAVEIDRARVDWTREEAALLAQVAEAERQRDAMKRALSDERKDRIALEELLAVEQHERRRLHVALQTAQGRPAGLSGSMGDWLRTLRSALRRGPKAAIAELRWVRAIRASGLFRPGFYRAQRDDLERADDAVWHYVRHGAREGVDPSAEFSSEAYLRLNPDVAESGVNPLAHYVMTGRAEEREVRPSDWRRRNATAQSPVADSA